MTLKRKIYFTRTGRVYITDRSNCYSMQVGEKVFLYGANGNFLYLQVSIGGLMTGIHITRERAMKVFDKKDLMVALLVRGE